MTSIPRRSFIKQAGQATALGYLGDGLAAASGRVVLITDPSDTLISASPVQWAIGELRQAVEAKGAVFAVVTSAADAGDFSLAIVTASDGGASPAKASGTLPPKYLPGPRCGPPLLTRAVTSTRSRNWPIACGTAPIWLRR